MVEDLRDRPGAVAVLHLLADVAHEQPESVKGRLTTPDQVGGFVKSHASSLYFRLLRASGVLRPAWSRR